MTPVEPTVDRAEFSGRVALVTGAAGGGIGESVARRLAAGGADVVLTDVHPGRTSAVAAAVGLQFPGARVIGLPLDVGDQAAIEATVAQAAAELGPITMLVNNAAINIMAPIWDYRPSDWYRVMDVNLHGPWHLCRLVMPMMRTAGGGSIVNVSSYAPDVGGQGLEGPYAVSKGGLGVLTRSCAHEGGPFGIRVNTVSMGVVRGTRFIDTHPEILDNPTTAGVLPWLPHASDVAETIAFLSSERARSITGETVNVSAGSYMRI